MEQERMFPQEITTGVEAPTSNFDLAITERFPNPNQRYLLESSIENSYDRNFLSVNANLDNGRISDGYLEFFIPGTDSEFIDLSSISLEIKLRVLRADGNPVDQTDSVTVVDGCFHRIFNAYTLFLNETQVEGNTQFGLLSVIKNYITMTPDQQRGLGLNMGYKHPDTTLVSTVTAADVFDEQTGDRRYINNYVVGGLMHFSGPLPLDISTADSYLLDKIDLRLRLELTPAAVILLTPGNDIYSYRLELCKLWVKRMVPAPSAMISLNRSLHENNTLMEYKISKPLVKTQILQTGQRNLVFDSPFGSIIPHRLLLFTLAQDSSHGLFGRDSVYFWHSEISDVKLEVNGNCVSNISANFPREVAEAYFKTMKALDTGPNLITRQNFARGRTILAFDTRSTNTEDTITLEKRGHLRMNITLANPAIANRIVYLVGFTTGIIQVNAMRRVFTSYLQ